MEPPALTRRGDAQRISEAFHERYAGKLTQVDGIAAIRQRLYVLCLDGQGGFDGALFAALKSHVSLREALEIEAIKCVVGDSRHAFQEFYGKWLAEQRAASKDVSKLGQLDPARLLEEIEMTRQAISEHEAMLAEHRAAIISKQPSPLRDADVDATHATLDSLRASLAVVQDEYARALAKHTQAHRDGGG